MKTNSKKFSIKDWFEKNKLYILAFVLPILSMLIVYYFKDIFPFGDQMYLRSDCYHQYTPYLEILQQKLKDGGSLFYTWEIGAGMNFMAVAAYYLTSPLNLLAIIWPGYMADMVSFFIVLKMGLAGFSVCYYLTKRFGQKNISSVVFGMAYALSAYFAAFSWNIMWLDCMWLLPFIVLGLEKLVNEKKCKMYCISLALAIFSNYYIGLMICIFSIIYFVYLFCIVEFDETVEKTKARLLILKDYAIYSILGGALAACVILPEYFSLLTTKSADSSFPTTLEETVSMLYMIFRSLICVPVADLKYYPEPNIYCSVAIFILIPLFWMCKKINVKERIGKTVIALIMLLSFGLNIPAYIWHGFHFPNSLPCRQSFLYIFLILTMCYEAFLYIREYEPKHIAWATGGSVALVFLLDQLFKDASIFSDLEIETSIVKIIYFSLLFIVVYACLIVWYKKAPKLKPFLSYLMVLIVFCELTLNMNVTGIPSTSGRKGYYEATKAYDQLNNITKKDADSQNVKYYRTESAVHVSLDQREHVAAEQPRLQGELLQTLKIVQAQRVTVLLFPCPQPEFHLRRVLPLLRRLRGDAQHLAVHGRFERQPRPDDLGAVGIDRRRSHRRGHVEHSRPLPQGGVVAVDVLIGSAAVRNKSLERPPRQAGPGFAVPLRLRRGCAAAVFLVAQCLSPPVFGIKNRPPGGERSKLRQAACAKSPFGRFAGIIFVTSRKRSPVAGDDTESLSRLAAVQLRRQLIDLLLRVLDLVLQIRQVEARQLAVVDDIAFYAAVHKGQICGAQLGKGALPEVQPRPQFNFIHIGHLTNRRSVTSPQALVSMIVSKAVKMASMMHVPVLGFVENYSYFTCPDCGKQLAVFGESGLDAVAASFDLPVLARLPIDPSVARAFDQGEMESLATGALAGVVEAVEKL